MLRIPLFTDRITSQKRRLQASVSLLLAEEAVLEAVLFLPKLRRFPFGFIIFHFGRLALSS
jgi:hypothetical protein